MFAAERSAPDGLKTIVAIAVAASGPEVPDAVDEMVNSAWEAVDCQPHVDSRGAGVVPTFTYHVLAYVRDAGSDGPFRPRRFDVEAPAGIGLAEIARQIEERHGSAFELHHVERASCEGNPIPSTGDVRDAAPPAIGPGAARASSSWARTPTSACS